MIIAMTDAELNREIGKTDDLKRQLLVQQAILLIMAAALIIGPLFLAWWVKRQYPSIGTISISDVQTVGSTDLCPGDNLRIRFAFHATGAGLLIRDSTIWRTSPPETIVFSAQRRFILSGPIDQELLEVWPVPETFISADTGQAERLLPGAYERLISISSPSRSNVIAIASAPFVIREDCP